MSPPDTSQWSVHLFVGFTGGSWGNGEVPPLKRFTAMSQLQFSFQGYSMETDPSTHRVHAAIDHTFTLVQCYLLPVIKKYYTEAN